MESYVSQTIKQSIESQNTQYNVSRHSEGAGATEESTQSKSIKKESTQKDSHNTIQSVESKNRDSHTTDSHLIQSQAKRDSKDSQSHKESQINH